MSLFFKVKSGQNLIKVKLSSVILKSLKMVKTHLREKIQGFEIDI